MAEATTTTTTASSSPPKANELLPDSVLKSSFAQPLETEAIKPLRVTCYGSSSSKTPLPYLRDAAAVGYLLAVRGHTCVNGAGSYGCMAAMNEGAVAGDGHIVGVIHEMWFVDGDVAASGMEYTTKSGVKLRDGGAHRAFQNKKQTTAGPIREMLVAGGKDLQERKRLLVDKADALVVLPGGPGTWDELWEMACARNIGLSKLPIVCVNTNGYYEPFRQMLERAYKDELTKLRPEEVVHFANTAEEAIRWVEEVQSKEALGVELRKRESALRTSSVLNDPVPEQESSASFLGSFHRSVSGASSWAKENESLLFQMGSSALLFSAGLAAGLVWSQRVQGR